MANSGVSCNSQAKISRVTLWLAVGQHSQRGSAAAAGKWPLYELWHLFGELPRSEYKCSHERTWGDISWQCPCCSFFFPPCLFLFFKNMQTGGKVNRLSVPKPLHSQEEWWLLPPSLSYLVSPAKHVLGSKWQTTLIWPLQKDTEQAGKLVPVYIPALSKTECGAAHLKS